MVSLLVVSGQGSRAHVSIGKSTPGETFFFMLTKNKCKYVRLDLDLHEDQGGSETLYRPRDFFALA